MGESSDTWRSEQNAAEEEHGKGGREDGQREAAATPQREEEEERMQTGMEQQPTAADSVEAGHSPGVNVNRPKRSNRGQPVYYPAKRAKATNADGEGRSVVTARRADSGSGKVYIQRMERTGMERRDAGRPPREPG